MRKRRCAFTWSASATAAIRGRAAAARRGAHAWQVGTLDADQAQARGFPRVRSRRPAARPSRLRSRRARRGDPPRQRPPASEHGPADGRVARRHAAPSMPAGAMSVSKADQAAFGAGRKRTLARWPPARSCSRSRTITGSRRFASRAGFPRRELAPADSSLGPQLTAADLRADPEGTRGKSVQLGSRGARRCSPPTHCGANSRATSRTCSRKARDRRTRCCTSRCRRRCSTRRRRCRR